MKDLPISQLLKELGIADGESQRLARQSLAEWGVIRPDRQRIAAYKRDDALLALSESFLWHCGNGDCRGQARRAPPPARSADDRPAPSGSSDDRPPLLVEQPACSICQGSPDASALRRMAEALRAAGLSKVLVVGGSQNKRQEILRKSPPGIQWRLLDGTTAKPDRLFRPDREWAEVIVLWGSTELDHRVSDHFPAKGDDRVITAARRGITALADAVTQHLRRHPPG